MGNLTSTRPSPGRCPDLAPRGLSGSADRHVISRSRRVLPGGLAGQQMLTRQIVDSWAVANALSARPLRPAPRRHPHAPFGAPAAVRVHTITTCGQRKGNAAARASEASNPAKGPRPCRLPRTSRSRSGITHRAARTPRWPPRSAAPTRTWSHRPATCPSTSDSRGRGRPRGRRPLPQPLDRSSLTSHPPPTAERPASTPPGSGVPSSARATRSRITTGIVATSWPRSRRSPA